MTWSQVRRMRLLPYRQKEHDTGCSGIIVGKAIAALAISVVFVGFEPRR